VFFPLLLIVLAAFVAAVAAYGTSASWAQYPHGLDLILWSRRLEWPLVTIAILLCLGLIALVIAGKRRAWWLIGLGPILALFAHRFVTDPAGAFSILENPTFVSADSGTLADDVYVVGLRFGDSSYAYPYSTLYWTPVVIQADHEKKMMLMWSAFANRAVADSVSRDLKARDLEIVSMPANALLLYNHRLGQFINGLKGQTVKNEKPTGFLDPIVISTMTWKDWRGINPGTKVMAPPPAASRRSGPAKPVFPSNPMPPAILDYPADTRIVLVGNYRPAALRSDDVSREPIRMRVDDEPVFVFKEAPDKPVKAFSEHIAKNDLLPRFRLNTGSKHKGAMFVDSDTDSGWSADGVWVDGMHDYKGTRLAPVPVQDGLYWGVMKFWYPSLQLTTAKKDE
jgi:hypothetical protein